MAWRLQGKPTYALEGSVFTAGAAVQWLRDELGIITTSAQSEEFACQASDTGGVHLVPAFTGLGAPHWNMYARGALLGITRGTNRGHICRAALESIAFQSDDLLSLMATSLGRAPQTLRVDGGASANNLLMQLQADISGIQVLRPQVKETTALGAALLAGLAVGMFESPQEALAQWRLDRAFDPEIQPQKRDIMRGGWQRAVKTALYEAALGRET
jgi:glycerol kinase